jgi:hypothetical protein
MPSAAIDTGFVHRVLSPDQIPIVLTDLLGQINYQQCQREWDSPFNVAPDPILGV